MNLKTQKADEAPRTKFHLRMREWSNPATSLEMMAKLDAVETAVATLQVSEEFIDKFSALNLEKEKIELLKAQGILYTRDLFERCRTSEGRDEVSKAANNSVTTDQLKKWVEMLDLTRIRGIGPKNVLAVYAKVKTTAALAEYKGSPEELAEALKENVDVVKNWLVQAQHMPQVVKLKSQHS
jgi:predicted flap endonuclease-1-like 5' DNA nuclease